MNQKVSDNTQIHMHNGEKDKKKKCYQECTQARPMDLDPHLAILSHLVEFWFHPGVATYGLGSFASLVPL